MRQEHKEKIAAALRGKRKSEAHKQALSVARKGKWIGSDNPNWKGGNIALGVSGYRLAYAPDHPHKITGQPYVLEHRLVAEQKLGRLLSREEVVHHINGDPSDNRPENLMVFASQSDHVRYEAQQRRADA